MEMKIGKLCVELGHGQIDLGQFYFICKIFKAHACTPVVMCNALVVVSMENP